MMTQFHARVRPSYDGGHHQLAIHSQALIRPTLDGRYRSTATPRRSFGWRRRAHLGRRPHRPARPSHSAGAITSRFRRRGGEDTMRIPMLLTAAGAALLGQLAMAQSVTYDYAKGTDFSRLRTYAWTRGTPVNDELNHRRIVSAIEAQLSAHGLVPAARTAPDVLVAYHASFDRNLQINGFASGLGYRPSAIRTGAARAEEVLVGSLAVDLVDARSGALVWRGIATHDVDTKANAQKRDKNIAKATEKLFRNYPPR
jgi:hypothetical protein